VHQNTVLEKENSYFRGVGTAHTLVLSFNLPSVQLAKANC